jgi:hypothetical protein
MPKPATTAPIGIHLFHRWGRWEDAEATHTSPLFPQLGVWQSPIQIRRCETCGKAQRRDL